jgi:hypothetical protein
LSTRIDVRCEEVTADAWRCAVRVDDGRGSPTTHDVTVSRAVLAGLDPGASEPTDLVRRSIVFLLGRESKESILRRFDLPVIATYFPAYEREIRR